eukprot:CAMPEP_0197254508 /NCGR_PEP_ID=MMETSP1429-20130617/68879_1 /TAXON_ID=49237 /ORGANISM="Chaetoceros  sp., Strain UNC1202" /LENGTH=278 /DNA_ID=CAMNT_0042717511 /DNA_START=202 /DNA_END=1038 /DNA_ORIENTATION=-
MTSTPDSHQSSEEQLSVVNSQTIDDAYRVYRREATIQLFCYVVAFTAYYVAPYVTVIFIILDYPSSSFVNGFMWSLLHPLGGLFNILIYLRPKIAGFRQRYPEYSWLHALGIILRNGGDIPDQSVMSGTLPTSGTDRRSLGGWCCCRCPSEQIQTNLNSYNQTLGRSRNQGEETSDNAESSIVDPTCCPHFPLPINDHDASAVNGSEALYSVQGFDAISHDRYDLDSDMMNLSSLPTVNDQSLHDASTFEMNERDSTTESNATPTPRLTEQQLKDLNT